MNAAFQGGRDGQEQTRFMPGEMVDLTIEDLAYGGSGIGRVEGLVVFVPGVVPGDRVRARIRLRKKSHAEADLMELLQASAERIPARCEHFGSCGGCQWMHLAYATQLAHKQRQVAECLARIGKLSGFTLHPIVPSPEVFAYRNKMEFDFAENSGGPYAGLHRAGDPTVIEPIQHCHLQDSAANRILQWVGARARALRLPASGQGSPEGLLRRLVIRRGSGDGRLLVVLITRAGTFVEGPSLASRMMEEIPEVGGVVRICARPDGSEGPAEVLAGEGTLRETIGGLLVTATASAFLQVNQPQAEQLYARVQDLAAVGRDDRILDLYCGAGIMTLLLGRDGREALGVEASPESVRCAERGARDNGLRQCRFLRGDARRVPADLAAKGSRFGLVVLNPPRAGVPEEVVRAVPRLEASRVIYVSCNPATLARDLGRFERLGYRATDIAPFDMFPHTYHIETVARLARMA